MNMSKKAWKLIGGIIGIVLGLLIANAPVPQGLTVKAMWGMGIFAWAVVWWMIDMVSDFGTAILMCCAWAGFNVVPISSAFSAFSSGTLWIIVGALGLGLAASKSGLLNRVALMTMMKFPLTFRGQSLSLLIAGMILTPFIPSATAKFAVLAPFAKSICDNMGYANKSKGATGLFSAMFVAVGLGYPIFLSGNFMCYAVLGLLPKDVQMQMTWTSWFINALPWGLTMLVLMYFSIARFYDPDEKTSQSKIDSDFLRKQLDALGAVTKNEKIVAVVIVCALALWMTERSHGINSAIVALVGVVILLACNVIDRNSFRSGIAWDAVIFLGALIGISRVFADLKIDRWLSTVFGPYLSPLVSGNIFVFFIALSVFIYVVRVFLVSQLAAIAMFVIVLTPVSIKAGISPWVTAFVVFVAVNVWYVFYHNASFLVGYYATGGDMVEHKQTVKLCLAYMAASILGIMISVPVWMMTGLIK